MRVFNLQLIGLALSFAALPMTNNPRLYFYHSLWISLGTKMIIKGNNGSKEILKAMWRERSTEDSVEPDLELNRWKPVVYWWCCYISSGGNSCRNKSIHCKTKRWGDLMVSSPHKIKQQSALSIECLENNTNVNLSKFNVHHKTVKILE